MPIAKMMTSKVKMRMNISLMKVKQRKREELPLKKLKNHKNQRNG
jgi:hypothetical protein